MERINVLNGQMLQCLEAFRALVTINDETVVSASSIVLDSIVQFHNEKLEIMNAMDTAANDFQTPPRARDVQPTSPPRLLRQVAVGGPLDESGSGWYSRQMRGQMGAEWYAHEVQRQTNQARFERSRESPEMDSPVDDDGPVDNGPMQLSELMDAEATEVQLTTPTTNDGQIREEFDLDEYYGRLMNVNWTIEDSMMMTDAQEDPGIGNDGSEMSMANVTVRPRRVEKCVRAYRTLLSDNMDQPHNHSCNVCFETPTIRDACHTNCGHHFCKSCFQNWESATRREPGRAITCPVCRAERPTVTEFEFI